MILRDLVAIFSFVIKNESGQVVAVALNFDVFDEPVVEPHVRRLAYVFEFLESVEGPVREKHFEKKTNLLIHSFMMATAETSTPSENVLLIQRMEQETLSLAKQRGFAGVFTTNTNELTRVYYRDNFSISSSFQSLNCFTQFSKETLFKLSIF